MTIFGFEFQPGKESLSFLAATHERLQNPHLIQNPFKGGIKIYDCFGVFEIYPVFPRLWMFGLIVLIGLVIALKRFSLWMLPSMFLLGTGFFWSKYFYFLALIIGMKRNKCNGKVKLLSNSETLRRCAFGTV